MSIPTTSSLKEIEQKDLFDKFTIKLVVTSDYKDADGEDCQWTTSNLIEWTNNFYSPTMLQMVLQRHRDAHVARISRNKMKILAKVSKDDEKVMMRMVAEKNPEDRKNKNKAKCEESCGFLKVKNGI